MENLIILTDYKGHFGSKYDATPYNSGMDIELLTEHFTKCNVNIQYMSFAEVSNYKVNYWKGKKVLYTSSEDTGFFYKSFIEDIIYYLEVVGAFVIPQYKYLRANNNKVFMELLRKTFIIPSLTNFNTGVFGCFEEISDFMPNLEYPIVYKKAAGAMGKGVGVAYNLVQLSRGLKKISRTKQYMKEIWEWGRMFKYKNYIQQSKYRNKFIVQNFINGLNEDYKVLVFGDKFYVLKRSARKGDFRASGSGIRSFIKELPVGLLEFASLCYEVLDVPSASIDIAFDGKTFSLIEFQCIYFGSFTITFSEFYWKKKSNKEFDLVFGKSVLEEEYVHSVIKFLSNE